MPLSPMTSNSSWFLILLYSQIYNLLRTLSFTVSSPTSGSTPTPETLLMFSFSPLTVASSVPYPSPFFPLSREKSSFSRFVETQIFRTRRLLGERASTQIYKKCVPRSCLSLKKNYLFILDRAVSLLLRADFL